MKSIILALCLSTNISFLMKHLDYIVQLCWNYVSSKSTEDKRSTKSGIIVEVCVYVGHYYLIGHSFENTQVITCAEI